MGDPWEELGCKSYPPQEPLIRYGQQELSLIRIIDRAIEIGRVRATEGGRVKEAGVRRLCNRIGHRTPFYRDAWRRVFSAYFGAQARGRALADDEKMDDARKGGSGH